MTDQTKQRITEAAMAVYSQERYMDSRIAYEDFVKAIDAAAEVALSELSRQSAASAAAALRMAAETIKRNWNDQSSAEDILALITPDQSADLASMLEEAEKRGHTRAMVEVAVSTFDRDARVREETIEYVAAKCEMNPRFKGTFTATEIRALKSKGPSNDDKGAKL